MSTAKVAKKMSIKKKKPKRTLAGQVAEMKIGDLGSYLMEAAGTIRRVMNVECKRFDNISPRAALSTSGTMACLSFIPLGDNYNQRDGRSIRTMGLEMRIVNELDPAVTLKDLVRTVVFADLENAGSAPAVTDLLTTAHPMATFNVNNLARFIPVWDNLEAVETYTTEYRTHTLKLPLDEHIRFRGDGATAADQAEGSLWLCVIKLSATANSSFQTLYSRLSYVDN